VVAKMDERFYRVLRFLDAVSRGKTPEEVIETLGPLTLGECEILETVATKPIPYWGEPSPMVKRLIMEGYLKVESKVVAQKIPWTGRRVGRVYRWLKITDKGRKALETICRTLKEKYGR